jgi:hypothetical protein
MVLDLEPFRLDLGKRAAQEVLAPQRDGEDFEGSLRAWTSQGSLTRKRTLSSKDAANARN